MALIHVIIPVYNARKYLKETVESVLSQPCNAIDIVLIDDGSTDGSSELCDELAMQEERVFAMHQKNSGVSVARNAGINYFIDRSLIGSQENEFLAFLDADDLWNTDIFTDDIIERIQMEQGTEVYAFGSTCCNEDCSRFMHPHTYEESCFDGGNGVIWKTQGRHFCANLYHLQLFKKWGIRFREGLKYSEDKIFMMQCVFLAEKVQFMPQIVHIYRQNTNSAMGASLLILPIDYYTPIIDGWIASDFFLNSFEKVTNKATDAGFILASIYFMDMASDHYKHWGKSKELKNVKKHPYYYLFENMDPKCVSVKQYKNHKLLKEHPIIYKIKYNAIGAVEFLARKMIKFKPVHDYRMKKKYPVNMILINHQER